MSAEDHTDEGGHRCEKCQDEPAEVTLNRSGRVWGKFCVSCHDDLAAVAAGQAVMTESEIVNHIHELRENGTSFHEISMTLPFDRKQVEEMYEDYDSDELPLIKH